MSRSRAGPVGRVQAPWGRNRNVYRRSHVRTSGPPPHPPAGPPTERTRSCDPTSDAVDLASQGHMPPIAPFTLCEGDAGELPEARSKSPAGLLLSPTGRLHGHGAPDHPLRLSHKIADGMKETISIARHRHDRPRPWLRSLADPHQDVLTPAPVPRDPSIMVIFAISSSTSNVPVATLSGQRSASAGNRIGRSPEPPVANRNGFPKSGPKAVPTSDPRFSGVPSRAQSPGTDPSGRGAGSPGVARDGRRVGLRPLATTGVGGRRQGQHRRQRPLQRPPAHRQGPHARAAHPPPARRRPESRQAALAARRPAFRPPQARPCRQASNPRRPLHPPPARRPTPSAGDPARRRPERPR